MKLRVFQRLIDNRFEVRVETEDWSAGDVELMGKFGEPEIDVGGTVTYLYSGSSSSSGSSGSGSSRQKTFDTQYVRIMTRFPYVRTFDGRDYDSLEEAKIVGVAWKELAANRIEAAVKTLRSQDLAFQTEEVTEL